MEQQPLGKLAPAQPHGASSLRPAHLGPAPGDAAPVKRKRGRPPGAKNKKTAAREAAEDEAERRLRRNAALMAEVMSAEGASESKSTSAGEEENSREERLRAALAAATAGDTRPAAARAEDGRDDAFAALLARVDDAATAEDARTAVAAFRERFEQTAAAGRRGKARVTGAATLRRVQGGADVPRGWTATSVSL
ncbi:hypothetical protein MICPUN_114068 [Micromonas commoda]|uniref:Uncharacterized protein n=1 Tax=Micromonas commoda (strain RCC299 / NOUM17 / CCMP2709) TaxID=296587 RepID=C1E2U2_MICCC|nr:hypothetical protein MICPUN_114068 [Micromonas commoda]ACO62403.1 hypothetical protein MICPUN_114068 [Micromonas commoda]|eukprot:XP_002501145.1 hypothetical protein MICPUN_114068 [Micromonas commoda]